MVQLRAYWHSGTVKIVAVKLVKSIITMLLCLENIGE